ncbi:MAG: hypothetical protein R3B70_05290 [Polyangiaceae bacterium]
MMLQEAASALAAGQSRVALGHAAGLSSLGAPSRRAKDLAPLAKTPATRRGCRIAPKRRPKDVPSLEDLITAVHVLASALD